MQNRLAQIEERSWRIDPMAELSARFAKSFPRGFLGIQDHRVGNWWAYFSGKPETIVFERVLSCFRVPYFFGIFIPCGP